MRFTGMVQHRRRHISVKRKIFHQGLQAFFKPHRSHQVSGIVPTRSWIGHSIWFSVIKAKVDGACSKDTSIPEKSSHLLHSDPSAVLGNTWSGHQATLEEKGKSEEIRDLSEESSAGHRANAKAVLLLPGSALGALLQDATDISKASHPPSSSWTWRNQWVSCGGLVFWRCDRTMDQTSAKSQLLCMGGQSLGLRLWFKCTHKELQDRRRSAAGSRHCPLLCSPGGNLTHRGFGLHTHEGFLPFQIGRAESAD